MGGMKDLSGSWVPAEDGWSSFPAQDGYSLLQLNPNGVATFTVQRKKSGAKILKFAVKEKASWVAFYSDSKNHLLFELESGQLTVFEILQGSRKQKGKTAVDKDSDDVRVQISADQAVVDIGKAHLVTTPDKKLSGGKFGFKGPVGLKDFHFQGAR